MGACCGEDRGRLDAGASAGMAAGYDSGEQASDEGPEPGEAGEAERELGSCCGAEWGARGEAESTCADDY